MRSRRSPRSCGPRAPEDVAAEPIGSLPTEFDAAELPDSVGGRPVLGISDDDLAPVGFEPAGAFVLAGAPSSGRTTALIAIAQSIARFDPSAELYYIGNRRSVVRSAVAWTELAGTPEDARTLAKTLSPRMSEALPDAEHPRIVVVIEGIAEFLSGPADPPLVE